MATGEYSHATLTLDGIDKWDRRGVPGSFDRKVNLRGMLKLTQATL